MPLSENEQKLLEQMERALSAEDPRFASQMMGTMRPPAFRRRIVLGAVVGVLGLGLVVLGVATSTIGWGALGFVVMVAGVAWAVTPTTVTPTSAGDNSPRRPASPKRPRTKRQGTLGQRMEERWEQRRRQQGL